MKVILSRKGMDSTAGGIASPILPDGTLLSLPIPDDTSKKPYEDFGYKGRSLREIIQQISPRFNFDKKYNCHLDPDIYDEMEGRGENWKAAFGQHDISAMHLDKNKVGVGDIFLFYGMYRETECRKNGTLKYVPNAPVLHIIYGYMKVREILTDSQEIESLYPWHPHSKMTNFPHNRLYLPEEYGTFKYDERLVLTKKDQNCRRLWALPEFFAESGISISWQGENRPVLKEGYAELNSSRRGQEFVIEASSVDLEKKLFDWVDELIRVGQR